MQIITETGILGVQHITHTPQIGHQVFESAQSLVRAAFSLDRSGDERNAFENDVSPSSFLEMASSIPVAHQKAGPHAEPHSATGIASSRVGMSPLLHCQCTFVEVDGLGLPAVSNSTAQALQQAQLTTALTNAVTNNTDSLP